MKARATQLGVRCNADDLRAIDAIANALGVSRPAALRAAARMIATQVKEGILQFDDAKVVADALGLK